MKTTLSDLNNHLFAQLERLADKGLEPDAMEREVARTEAIVGLSDQVLRIADTGLKAAKLFAEHGETVLPHLPRIGAHPPRTDGDHASGDHASGDRGK